MEPMLPLSTRHLFDWDVQLHPAIIVGGTPPGNRLIAPAKSGTFEGERIRGRMLGTGGDFALGTSDGRLRLDIRVCLETEDQQLVYVEALGRIHAPEHLMRELFDPQVRGTTDPSRYYFRTAPLFSTTSVQYEWLNGVLAVGVGRITEKGVAYSVYEVL